MDIDGFKMYKTFFHKVYNNEGPKRRLKYNMNMNTYFK